MEIKNMTVDELEARKAEIAGLLDSEGADLDAFEAEVRSINEEIEQRKTEAAKKAELRKMVASGEADTKTIEKNEEKTMEEVRTFAVDSKEYREAFLKKLQGKELNAEERAAMTATAAIPTQTVNEIYHKLDKNPLIAAVDIMHFPNFVSMPKEDTVADATWTSTSTDSEDALGSLNLSAYQLMKTVSISAQVKAMSIDAFEGWLVERLVNKLQKAIDNAILNGTGSDNSQPTGIKTTKSTADGTYTRAAMTYADLCKIIGSLGTAYHTNASFVMPRLLFFQEVLGLTDTNKQKVVVADVQSPAKFNILGYPVICDDNAATDEVYFGDLKSYKFNFAQDIEVAIDDSVDFRSGKRCYRGMCLADGKLIDSSAIVRYTRATA